MRKEEIELSLFVGKIALYVENPEKPQRNCQNKFSKMANLTKSM